MRTRFWTLQPKQQWKFSITTALIVLIVSGVLFGTIDATQIYTPDLDTQL